MADERETTDAVACIAAPTGTFDRFVRAVLYASATLVVASGLLAGLALAVRGAAEALPALPATVVATALFVVWVTLGVTSFGLVVVALVGVVVHLLGWRMGLLAFAAIMAVAWWLTVQGSGPPF